MESIENANRTTATCISCNSCNKKKCRKYEASKKNAILKSVSVIFILLLTISTVNAQSIVYFLTPDLANCTKETFTINGQSAGNFLTNDNINKEKYPFLVFYPTSRKCILQDEGRYVFKVTFFFFTLNLNDNSVESVRPYYAEKQINLTTGSVHYLYFTHKGLNDFQIKEISEREALKYMNHKKCVVLPQYIEE